MRNSTISVSCSKMLTLRSAGFMLHRRRQVLVRASSSSSQFPQPFPPAPKQLEEKDWNVRKDLVSHEYDGSVVTVDKATMGDEVLVYSCPCHGCLVEQTVATYVATAKPERIAALTETIISKRGVDLPYATRLGLLLPVGVCINLSLVCCVALGIGAVAVQYLSRQKRVTNAQEQPSAEVKSVLMDKVLENDTELAKKAMLFAAAGVCWCLGRVPKLNLASWAALGVAAVVMHYVSRQMRINSAQEQLSSDMKGALMDKVHEDDLRLAKYAMVAAAVGVCWCLSCK